MILTDIKLATRFLLKIANYIKEATRRADTVARWGGDELILLLTGLHNQEETYFVCERIRRSVQDKLRDDSLGIPVTLSMGVAICPDDSQTTELLEQQADTAYMSQNGEAEI
jgi:diguanylate cyclase (GGDEF)-like protein